MAPPPKPKSARRNFSKPRTGEWVEIPCEKLPEAAHPPLPFLSGRSWSSESKKRWDAWRFDPAALFWSPADLDYAIETLALYEIPEPGPIADFLTPPKRGRPKSTEINWAEISRRRDRLGLTPKGKRDLRLQIMTPASAVVVPQISETPENVVELDPRRNRLFG